jgi:glycosyltransferase involved in cell wall biosynthesis
MKLDKYCIYIESGRESISDFLQSEINNGLPGTEWQAVSLFKKLTLNKIKIDLIVKNLKNYQIFNENRITEENSLKEYKYNKIIVPAIYNCNILKEIAHEVIIWIHHPFFQIDKSKIDRYVACGQACADTQLFFIRKKMHVISNFLPKVPIFKEENNNELTFIGALIKSKGILRLLKDMPKIEKRIKIDVLNIIGSSQMYTNSAITNNEYYCDDEIRNKIRYLLKKIKTKVIFHGQLGYSRYQIMSQSNMIIINPTGNTEAFSTSILESFLLGKKFSAGNRYGNYEFLKDKPDYHYSIDNVVNCWGINNIKQIHNYRKQIEDKYNDNDIVDLWIDLLKENGEKSKYKKQVYINFFNHPIDYIKMYTKYFLK